MFRRKYKPDGNVDRYKARFVVRGFKQISGVDYLEHELFSPVVRIQTVRFLLALTAELNLELEHLDVCTTFLYGELKEVIYVKQPAGFVDKDYPDRVCRLLKSLYGLKQSPKNWYEKIDFVLLDNGFIHCESDPNLYISVDDTGMVLLALYVDDLILAATSKSLVSKVKEILVGQFKMKMLGDLNYCLGVQVHRNKQLGTVCIHQSKYVSDILQKFSLSMASPVSTPIVVGVKLTAEDQPVSLEDKRDMDSIPYRAAVGCLIYLTVWTRLDIAKATQEVAQFSNNPGRKHWQAVKRIYRYLSGTRRYGLTFTASGNKRLTLTGWTDADWAANPDSRKSIAAYVFTLNGAAVSWSSKLLPTVCLSSTESEYGALTRAGKEAVACRATLKDVSQTQVQPTTVNCDNQSAISLCYNVRFHARTRHIEVAHHFIRHLVSTKQVTVKFVKTEDNLADLLTKGLSRDRHFYLVHQLGLTDLSPQIENKEQTTTAAEVETPTNGSFEGI